MSEYEIKIKTSYDPDSISQKVIFPNMQKATFEGIVKLQDEEIRKALKNLGWLPPEEAKQLKEENKRLKKILAEMEQSLCLKITKVLGDFNEVKQEQK